MALLILSTLVVTTVSCYGLLALWAGTSGWRWYVRAAAVFVALGLPVAIPAYELAATFAIQTLTVVLALQAHRWFRGWRARRRSALQDEHSKSDDVPAIENNPATQGTWRFHFSLASLLWITVFVALSAVAVVKSPSNVWEYFDVIVAVGLFAGLQTLTAAWIAHGRWRWWLQLPLAIIAVVGFFWLLSWLLVEVTSTPPGSKALDVVYGRNAFFLFSLIATFPWKGWTFYPCDFVILHNYAIVPWGIVVAVLPVLVMALWLALWRTSLRQRATRDDQPRTWPGRLRIAVVIAALTLLAAVLVTPPAAFYVWMLHPTPIPPVVVPEPNGYDDFLAAGRQLDTPVIQDYYTATARQLRAEIAKHARAYNQVERGLKRECQPPLDYTSSEFGRMVELRTVGMALSARGRLADLEDRYGDSLDDYLKTVRLGEAIGRGGVAVDFLVGVAIKGIGLSWVDHVRQHLSPDECRRAIEALHQIDRQCEPLDDVLRRESIWAQHAMGWQGRLDEYIDLLAGDYLDESLKLANSRSRARLRLVMTDLAVRAFATEQGRYPQNLAELVPDYLPELPADPFGSGPLVYRPTTMDQSGVTKAPPVGDPFTLYSIGPDRSDDGGKIISWDQWLELSDTGDLGLATFRDE